MPAAIGSEIEICDGILSIHVLPDFDLPQFSGLSRANPLRVWRLTIGLGKSSADFHSLAPRLEIEANFDQSGGVRLS